MSGEFIAFDTTMRELLKVPHSEIKAKLDEEKAAKKRKKPKKSSVPRGSLVGQGIRRTGFASELSVSEALSDYVRGNVLETLFPIANNRCANLSTTFQNALNCNLVFSASFSNPALALVGVHEASSTADEGFICFDWSAVPTHRNSRTVLHRQTDAMQHEPCGFLS